MTFKPERTQQHLQTPEQKAEAAFHQAIRGFLTKRDQGRVMGVYRDFIARGLISTSKENIMTDISRHPVLKQAYDVCLAIEKCGASPELTAAVTKASDLLRTLGQLYDTTEAQVASLPMTEYGLRQLQTVIHQQNVDMGWWDNPREDGTLLMLMVSELAEAMEGTRKNLMDDHLPHRKMEEVELADAVIRILDYAGAKGYDIAGALVEKLVYNRTRADHQRENREKDNGKKF